MKPNTWKMILTGIVLALTLGTVDLVNQINLLIPDGYITPQLIQPGEFLDSANATGIASYACEPISCSYQGTSVLVTLASTSGDMEMLLKEQMIAGVFYQESTAMEENRWAVIDEALAVQFFMSTNVCGRAIRIGQTEYTICGVVSARTDGLQELFSDGRLRVYIPANSQEGLALGTAVAWCARSNSINSSADAAVAFTQYSDSYISELDVVDIISFKEMAEAVKDVGICIALMSVIFLMKSIFYERIRKSLRSFASILNPLLCVSAIGAAVITFFLMAPATLLPDDNVFDLVHYWNEIVALLQLGNIYGGDTYFYLNQSIYLIVLIGIVVLAGCCLAVAIFIGSKEKRV